MEIFQGEIVTMSEVIVITSGKGGVGKTQLSPISEQSGYAGQKVVVG